MRDPCWTACPIAGILGDQQAATFGQSAFDAGDTKVTYGTGNFLIVSTGERVVRSQHGLITTVAFKLGDAPGALRARGLRRGDRIAGPVAARQPWRSSNTAEDIERLAATVPDNGGVYFVPAFSGLYAPYWRPDARGAVLGLTHFANKGHLARAVLEATAFQTADVLAAAEADLGVRPQRVTG